MRSKRKNKNQFRFFIKRTKSVPISPNESILSEDVKEFRRLAIKMNKGDSIEVSNESRARIFNYLRFRKITRNFKSRTISKEEDIVAIYCIRETGKHQLI
jgi:hypothetical protein